MRFFQFESLTHTGVIVADTLELAKRDAAYMTESINKR